jgi:hypothetical protein
MTSGKQLRSQKYQAAKLLGLNPVWKTSTVASLTQIINDYEQEQEQERQRVAAEEERQRVAEAQEAARIQQEVEERRAEQMRIHKDDRLWLPLKYIKSTENERLETITLPEFIDGIRQLMTPGVEYNLIIDGFEEHYSAVVKDIILTTDATKQQFNEAYKTLYSIAKMRWNYLDGYSNPMIRVRVQKIPDVNPPLRMFKNGRINCGIAPILQILKKRLEKSKCQKKQKATMNAIKKVEAMNTEYFESGISDHGLTNLSIISRVNIVVNDKTGAEWRRFGNYK